LFSAINNFGCNLFIWLNSHISGLGENYCGFTHFYVLVIAMEIIRMASAPIHIFHFE
jgi:hypothetical protein